MKKHAIIPIFIPHKGCPNDCVFCNQRKITARTADVSNDDVRQILDTWLTTLRPDITGSAEGRTTGLEADNDTAGIATAGSETFVSGSAGNESAVRGVVEAAFYGGSFTGLDIEEQSAYLAVTKEYKDAGLIDKVHLSTRPDYIDRQILDNLRDYGVDTIELGVQSFDDEVLRKSNRGHTSADVYKAVELIKEYGFELGIQLMIGLPGDSLETCVYSARETVRLQPSLARLYPTIVLDETELYEMYARGEYEPLPREEAVLRTKEMYKILDDAGITIMRVGLKSTDLIGEGGAINGGTYHPAFRQLVEGEIAKERIEVLLEELLKTRNNNIVITSNEKWFSNMVGHHACNKKYFAEKYPELRIRYAVDESLTDGAFGVS